jgi:hypothetical protein
MVVIQVETLTAQDTPASRTLPVVITDTMRDANSDKQKCFNYFMVFNDSAVCDITVKAGALSKLIKKGGYFESEKDHCIFTHMEIQNNTAAALTGADVKIEIAKDYPMKRFKEY